MLKCSQKYFFFLNFVNLNFVFLFLEIISDIRTQFRLKNVFRFYILLFKEHSIEIARNQEIYQEKPHQYCCK